MIMIMSKLVKMRMVLKMVTMTMETSWRSTDTNAGCEAKTNSLDGDFEDNVKVGEMIMTTKMVKLTMESIWRVKIDQHRTWTRLAASVKKGRGPRRIEVQ